MLFSTYNDAGEQLDPASHLGNLALESRGREEKVHDNAFFGLTRRHETNSRQTTD